MLNPELVVSKEVDEVASEYSDFDQSEVNSASPVEDELPIASPSLSEEQ